MNVEATQLAAQIGRLWAKTIQTDSPKLRLSSADDHLHTTYCTGRYDINWYMA